MFRANKIKPQNPQTLISIATGDWTNPNCLDFIDLICLDNSNEEMFASNLLHIITYFSDLIVASCGGLLSLLAAASASTVSYQINLTLNGCLFVSLF